MTTVDLAAFDNAWYDPGRPLPTRMVWLLVNRFVLLTSIPWPSAMKSALLRLFGARVGRGVVLKPRINIKYPWNISIGDHSWVGEGVWLDSIGRIEIGSHVCISQGVTIETGNHDWSKRTFDLRVSAVIIENGAWAAIQSLLLPGSHLAQNAILSAAAVLSGTTDANGIYRGNPAEKVGTRSIE